MADSTRQSDTILKEAGRSLAVQREGGHHRRAGKAIGQGSASLRQRQFGKRILYMLAGIFAVLLAAGVIGTLINGIGFVGIMATLLAMIVIVAVFAVFPRIKPPKRADLARTQDARQLVARTELWLEHQRPALPPPAIRIVEDIGVQLDALGVQLENVDPAHPAAAETRKLVGEILPDMIDSYRRIPGHLRREERGGSSPDAQLVDSLAKISKEIDQVTRQLAEGSLDDLAIRTRYLDYKYGDEALASPEKI